MGYLSPGWRARAVEAARELLAPRAGLDLLVQISASQVGGDIDHHLLFCNGVLECWCLGTHDDAALCYRRSLALDEAWFCAGATPEALSETTVLTTNGHCFVVPPLVDTEPSAVASLPALPSADGVLRSELHSGLTGSLVMQTTFSDGRPSACEIKDGTRTAKEADLTIAGPFVPVTLFAAGMASAYDVLTCSQISGSAAHLAMFAGIYESPAWQSW
ncbi:MAG: hypothetical protein EDR02_00275 [Actinobacteria bacterium]|nr:MAG: hypothetical protein EDR02_00275 [Actinomycetota bacterium]RIK05776.1 MAG: hypothetical protein DCC48_08900 [Acidobacteriota bacterium]